MSDIPSFAYELLWHERILRSVANLTREDAIRLRAINSNRAHRSVARASAARCGSTCRAGRYRRMRRARCLNCLPGVHR
jgi:propanol-preferring alcohol dehydrogenase